MLIHEGTNRDTLPPGWSLLFLPCSLATTSSLTPGDGTERSPYHSPPGSLLEERMWAGGSFSFPSPTGLKVGEDVECEITTPSVKDRVGKDGRRGWYVEQRRELRSAGEKGKPKVVETRVHLYRPTMEYATASSPAESPSPKSAPKPAVKKAADWSYPFHPTDIHLFRFSSITFNSHRIHWDRRYCREVEKRPGECRPNSLRSALLWISLTDSRFSRADLVVHGPFTALMLLTRFHHALSALSPNLRVADFSYRNTAALSVDTRIEFKGRWKDQEKGECELWVEDGEGVVYMMGEGKATAK